MKNQKKVEKIESSLFEAGRGFEPSHQPAENWQQDLMRDIHGIVYKEEQPESFVPAFVRRFALSVALVAAICLTVFILLFNVVFQSEQDQVISELNSWTTITDSTELGF